MESRWKESGWWEMWVDECMNFDDVDDDVDDAVSVSVIYEAPVTGCPHL